MSAAGSGGGGPAAGEGAAGATADDRPAVARGGEFLRFLITGGIAAGVNVGSRWLLSHAMPYEAAVLVAYLFGMTTAYLLARALVFAPSGRSRRDEFLRFALVNVAAAAQVWIISVGLARVVFPWAGMTWYAEDIAHVIGVVFPVFTSYLGHRHFSFGRK
ncbi:GtrA family protein [Caenispirillum bisanense]|uniref:Flippase GtrA (Transmembrane translocase of bactoprenol-linked glucose) n=1 Tax=Caenispirillum bisanense TaxID=414052 RepID=A0A286GTH9_9PROT|nr:GtrA family protein [Caenispirillum bisanense]SOD98742.1 Putative flippase GtrA (transmembrane translocase of bactoprenol-linked glucose) [Caenispirillum bisanense]